MSFMELDQAKKEATILVFPPKCPRAGKKNTKRIVEELKKAGFSVGFATACLRCPYSSMWCQDPCPFQG